jgi:molybdenum cofactor cytidylyltransferase
MYENTDCLMLAAGESRRMGKWKLTLPFKGSTVIQCSVKNALSVCRRVILVIGHRAEELESLFGKRKDIKLINNPEYRKPMFSSIKIGAPHVKTNRFFVALGDMPLVDSAVYEALLSYSQSPVVIPKYMGKKGHPLLLSNKLIKTIIQFDEKKTLRDVLADYPTLAVPVENRHILIDLDNPEDYKNFADG